MDLDQLELNPFRNRGINETSDGRMSDGRMIYVKRHTSGDETLDVTAEIAGAKFAQQLGLKAADFLHAGTVEDRYETRDGWETYDVWQTIQTALPGRHLTFADWDRGDGDRIPVGDSLLLADDARGFWLLDNLVQNGDRHSGNFLWDPTTKRTSPIDHGMARCDDYWQSEKSPWARGRVWDMPQEADWYDPACMSEMLLDLDLDAVYLHTSGLMGGMVVDQYFENVADQQYKMLDWLLKQG